MPRKIKQPKRIEFYEHKDKKRKNIPPANLADMEKNDHKPKKYSYDPHFDPQLVWAGKAEHTNFEVPTVSLHTHEKVSAPAILNILKNGKGTSQFNLFGDPDLPLQEAVKFYEHDINWMNRMILGDSLVVMNSLLEREMMRGQVQMIYIDPPYGVKFNSNFQPFVNKRDVKDRKDEDLTREPEQIKAYRDTWQLGIHSYLTYLRDRLLLAKELLNETGSCFVQISDENVHHVRELMDEIFEPENFISLITFRTKTGRLGSEFIDNNSDYIIFYAKNKANLKFREIYDTQDVQGDSIWNWVELSDGTRRRMSKNEIENHSLLPVGSKVFRTRVLCPVGFNENAVFGIEFNGKKYGPPGPKGRQSWTTNEEGIKKLIKQNRIVDINGHLEFIYYLVDFPFTKLNNNWLTRGAVDKTYVVQTDTDPIQRCILMTTDPGDLVLDPTCGSGTSAYVAEQWGRRWITMDTSRVALALARQRLLTAKYPYYKLAYPEQGVGAGFVYKTVPHITLKSIAQNEPPKQEILYDQPEIDNNAVRVSGPFSVEAIPSYSIEEPKETQSLDARARKDDIRHYDGATKSGATGYVQQMIDNLQTAGVFSSNAEKIIFENISIYGGGSDSVHATGTIKNQTEQTAIVFGPQYGPVTAKQALNAITSAKRNGFGQILITGFAFDPEVFSLAKGVDIKTIWAYAAPDIIVGDLLKKSKTDQLFTAFGEPEVEVKKTKDKKTIVKLLGVDYYDPTTGEVNSDELKEVAAWFLDTDYDKNSVFCIRQAFFPNNNNAWQKLEKALRGVIDQEKFDALNTFGSLPFETPTSKMVAIKVIDIKGQELIKVIEL